MSNASTIGDSLVSWSTGQSQVIAISGKDRSAILLGGRAGKAYWQDDGRFTTNDYYHDVVPEWLEAVNRSFSDWIPATWSLSRPENEYQREDELWYERPPGTVSKTFPHRLPDNHAVAHSPYLDSMVFAAAKAAVKGKSLGQGATPDLLLLGLSATDRMGHFFGPQSREMEDSIYRLDDELKEFVNWLDKEIGLANVLLVLTADHGADLVPEGTAMYKMPSARLDMPAVLSSCNEQVRQQLSVADELVSHFLAPYVYVQMPKSAKASLTQERFLDDYSRCLEDKDGVRAAFPSDNVKSIGSSEEDRLIANSLYPGRSGDIYVLQEASTYMHHDLRAATHGSIYSYDRHVPIAVYSDGICPERVWETVHPETIAATVSSILSIPAPPNASTDVLYQAIANLTGDCAAGADDE